MLDHHLQRSIVYQLAFADSLRFSDMQPDDVDSKLFTYHLKKVIQAGLVVKRADGSYELTPEGRRVGKGALKKQSRFIDRAYSQLLLVIRNAAGDWLLFERGTHPLRGLIGFMQAQPRPDQSIVDTATEVCKEKTGLDAHFSVMSHGFFRIYRGEQLESFTHFTLLVAGGVEGELIPRDELGRYMWEKDPDFTAPTMLPTAPVLAALSEGQPGVFVEHTFYLS